MKMTVREKLKDMLIKNGMFEDQAETVMEMAILKIVTVISNLESVWDSPAEENKEFYEVIWVYVKATAKDWIVANHPEARYLSKFK